MNKKQKQKLIYNSIRLGFFAVAFLWLYIYLETQSFEQASLYILLIFAVVLIGIREYRKHKHMQLVNSGIESIDRMNGVEFEQFLASYFKYSGYKVKLTPASGDYGADLVLEKGGFKTVVQAKRYSGKVNLKAVQEVIGAINYYRAQYSMVVTNSYFTQSAINLANSNGVELWDRKRLIEKLAHIKGSEIIGRTRLQSNTVLEISEEIQPQHENVCPICGSHLVMRNGKHGKFYGCSSFPSCRYTRNI